MTVGVFADTTGSDRLDAWIDRLDAFISALDAIDADDPFTFCTDAWDIWERAAVADPPPETSPATLVVLGVTEALADVMASAARDYPGAPAALTLSAVHASLTDELNAIRRECERWRCEGLPSADAVKALSATALAGLRVANDPAHLASHRRAQKFGAGPRHDVGDVRLLPHT
jgi:hypothetical protein